MATIREYFDSDFNSAARLHVRLLGTDELGVEAVILYDFSAYAAFLACYLPGPDHNLPFFEGLIKGLEYGNTSVRFDGRITLPSARAFPGQPRIERGEGLKTGVKFFGDPEWVSTERIQMTRRVFIYTSRNY